jgi:3-isopropylmalate/(R)-2-methylmalate dehydratase small subunit
MTAAFQGRCWRFSDDLASDQLIPPQHVFEYDPTVLRRHLLAEVRPELPEQAKPGDVLVTGRNFANGSHHSHPFLAMKEMGVGLICQTVSRGPFRLAVFVGVPLLVAGPEVIAELNDGDTLRVDFAAGRIANGTTGRVFQVEPLSPFLQDIVAAGGGLSHARALLEAEGSANAER